MEANYSRIIEVWWNVKMKKNIQQGLHISVKNNLKE